MIFRLFLFLILFQFHKGSIKTLLILSTPFRLMIFQFHKGSIKTQLHKKKENTKANFNSIKVRLRRPAPAVIAAPIQYFNSIKVRLRLCYCNRNLLVIIFQFHKGSIKTHTYRDDCGFLRYFNSIKVRLRRFLAQGGLSVAGGCRCLTKDGNTSIEKEGYIPYPLQA